MRQRWRAVVACSRCGLRLPEKRSPSSISLRFNGHFPGETGLAGVYWSKGWWRWWWQLDYWSYKSCKAPVKSSPPTSNFFYRLEALPVTQPTVSKHWREAFPLSSGPNYKMVRTSVLPSRTFQAWKMWLKFRDLPGPVRTLEQTVIIRTTTERSITLARGRP